MFGSRPPCRLYDNLIPARAGLNAVADPRGRNLQTGTAILNAKRILMLRIKLLVITVAIAAGFGCGASAPSNSNSNSNTNTNNRPVEIKVDPANMPAGLSTTPLPMPANGKMPEGISVNAATPLPRGTNIPGIPTAEELKKGIKKGTTPTPGIPDPETIRKQMGLPAVNINVPSKGPIMMKGNRKLGGKPQ